MIKKSLPDPSLKLRPATRADVKAVTDLIYTVCEADGDVTVAVSPEELEHAWREEGFTLETDAFIVETGDGQLVGYEEIFNEKAWAQFTADGYVHPQFKGRGIGSTLLTCAEERAREMMGGSAPDLRVFIHTHTDGRDEAGQELLKNLGYHIVRHFWRMEIKFESAPPAIELPAGIELRPFEKDKHAHTLWQADNEAFSEHWGSHAVTFDEWAFRKFERPEFDPTLWLVAWDGEQVAGFSQNRYRMGIGWVGSLGVRKAWRSRGLGLALLQTSFADFYRRGMATVGLGVDAANTTGATRLYERAGMRVASAFTNFEKELRTGRALEYVDGHG